MNLDSCSIHPFQGLSQPGNVFNFIKNNMVDRQVEAVC